jgi:DNA-binding GntR family transcriptional regulator
MSSRPEYKLALDSRQTKPLPQQVEEEILRLIKMRAAGFQVNEIFQVQDIARANRISRNTVTPAVRHLEQMGILDFNHKTGYRILKTEPTIQIPVREELPLSMGEWAQIHNCSLRDVYPFPAVRLQVGDIQSPEIRDTIKEWLLLEDQTPIGLIRRIRFLIRETDSTQSLPMYEEAYVRADALPELCDDFNRIKEEGQTTFSLFGYYLAHLKTKIRASHYFILADGLPDEVQPIWQRETTSPISSNTVFTRLDSVNFAGPTDVSPLEKGGSLQYGREYYPSPYFRFKSANRQVDLTFG